MDHGRGSEPSRRSRGSALAAGNWIAPSLLVLALGLAGCSGRTSSSPTPNPTASSTPLPSVGVAPSPTPKSTPPPARPLPDLVVGSAVVELETGGACRYASTELGTRATVENLGKANAGPFAVEVNGVRQVVVAGLAAGGELSLWSPGYQYGNETLVMVDAASQVQESDEENNLFAQMVPIPTLPPTCTPLAATLLPTWTPSAGQASTQTPVPAATDTPVPAPTETPVPAATDTPKPPSVSVREEQATIATYPYAGFTTQGWSEPFRMSYAVLDRGAYQASNPVPAAVSYRTVVVENEYLKLTFLPDLGGRLYEVIFKPTGHRETYRNPVLKPSPWGPSEQGWWLAAGGIEWCLPVEEHGYEWGSPWAIQTSRDASGVTVMLEDTSASDRVRVRIEVRLEAGSGYFTIRPRLENPTDAPLAVKYWTNAMLAPGGHNAPSADLRFVLPDSVTGVTVHSRGDNDLPDYNQRMPWPVVDGRDLSRLGNWRRWLGFFEDPAVGEFSAVYDEAYDEGMIRVFPAAVAQGAKAFGFGWSDPISADNWTDDGSGYVELHGGPAATFDDSITLAAGGHLEWTEVWYPVAGIGGLRQANGTAALNLGAGSGQVQIGVAVTRRWQGNVVLLLDGQERWKTSVTLSPGQPLRQSISLGQDVPEWGQLSLRLVAQDGKVPAEYSAQFRLK
jgi:hypothetical protein